MTGNANFGRIGVGQFEKAVEAPPEAELTCLPWNELDFDVTAWDALARSAAEPNPFFESWYLLPALEALDTNRRVSILRFERQGVLLGLMPVARQLNYYGRPVPHITNWIHPNCFLGTPLVARGLETLFWQALLDWADAHPGAAFFLHLREFVLGGPLCSSLEKILDAGGRKSALVACYERAKLESDLDPDSYLRSSLSQRKRKDLNRRHRRLSELGEVRFDWATGSQGLSAWTDDFLKLEASGWKGKAGSALACDPATRHVFRSSLVGAAERGRLIRLSLLLAGRPIAMLSTFAAPPGSFGYKTAFDEAFSRYSPGFLLEREFLRSLERGDIRWCDSCAASDHSVMNQIWNERRAIGSLSIAIGGMLRRATFEQLVRLETTRPTPEAQT